MRIIRVSGCHDCEYPDEEYLPPYIPCTHPDSPKDFNICHFIEAKSLPDNCPLEKVDVAYHFVDRKRERESYILKGGDARAGRIHK